MPYISIEDQNRLQPIVNEAIEAGIDTPGELNYLITELSMIYLRGTASQRHYDRLTYRDMNEVVGAIESSKLEFYRRMMVPYEDDKIAAVKPDGGDPYDR